MRCRKTCAKVVFAAEASAGVEEMPADARQAYESVKAAVEAGKGEAPGAAPVRAVSAEPIEPALLFSPGSRLWKIAAAVALGLILLYAVLRVMG
jgi:hypothetical protein